MREGQRDGEQDNGSAGQERAVGGQSVGEGWQGNAIERRAEGWRARQCRAMERWRWSMADGMKGQSDGGIGQHRAMEGKAWQMA